MKNLFSFNIDEKSEIASSSEILKPFVIREINDTLTENQKKISDKMDELESKWSLPPWLTYLRVAAVGIGAMLLACAIMILIGVGFSRAFTSVWFVIVFIIGILLTAFGTACFIIEAKRKKAVEGSREYKKAMDYIASLTEQSRNFLRLPEEKVSVDIFFYPYILKEGKMKDSGPFKYLNRSFYLFSEGELLCLSDSSAVYGIEKKLFKKMLIEPKKTTFTLWNKDEPHTKEPYKDYKIVLDHYGVYHVKNACSVQFTTADEDKFEIVIPPYEIKHFEEILNIKAKTNDEDNEETK